MNPNIYFWDNLLQYRFLELYQITKEFTVNIEDIFKVTLLYCGYTKCISINTKIGRIKVSSLNQYRFALDKYTNKYKTGIDQLIVECAKEYGDMKIKDKIVFDIGANVGDSALFFATNGAKKVYAYEPYPYLYKKAKINISKKRLKSKITLINEAVSGGEDTILLPSNYKATGGSSIKNFKSGKKIHVTSLLQISRKYNTKNACLKIDCEGSEYEILLKTPKAIIRNFSEIALEYHYGYINLRNYLIDSGFKVTITRPKKIYNPEAENPNMVCGLLYAKRD